MPAEDLVYIVGLGAIGSVYAAKIQDRFPERLRIVMDDARVEKLAEHPIVVDGTPRSFRFAKSTDEGQAFLAIIAVKSIELESAMEAIKPYISPRSIILPLMNGLDIHDRIREKFPLSPVLYGVVYTIALRTEHLVQSKAIGRLILGQDEACRETLDLTSICKLLESAGIPTCVDADIRHTVWKKFMLNVGINQVSAVLRSSYDKLKSNPYARSLIREAALEVIAIAGAAKVELSEADILSIFEILYAFPPEGKSSMLQDVEASRPTEVDTFAGTVIRLGERYGVPTPMNHTFYELLSAIAEDQQST